MTKTLLLFSGGIDSTVILYSLMKKGIRPLCLTFNYNQRHKKELSSAEKIAKKAGCSRLVIKLDLGFSHSSLISPGRITGRNTYVPGRNMLFLSYASSVAESLGIKEIYIGANKDDSRNFPDCRREFIKSFSEAIQKGQRKKIKIRAPLLNLTKQEIIARGIKLKVSLEDTWSCYAGGKKPCGVCEPCRKLSFSVPLLAKRGGKQQV